MVLLVNRARQRTHKDTAAGKAASHGLVVTATGCFTNPPTPQVSCHMHAAFLCMRVILPPRPTTHTTMCSQRDCRHPAVCSSAVDVLLMFLRGGKSRWCADGDAVVLHSHMLCCRLDCLVKLPSRHDAARNTSLATRSQRSAHSQAG